jgi:hypothetical protein
MPIVKRPAVQVSVLLPFIIINKQQQDRLKRSASAQPRSGRQPASSLHSLLQSALRCHGRVHRLIVSHRWPVAGLSLHSFCVDISNWLVSHASDRTVQPPPRTRGLLHRAFRRSPAIDASKRVRTIACGMQRLGCADCADKRLRAGTLFLSLAACRFDK